MSCINNHRIIASSYGNSFGIPVVFGREYFGELTNLDGDTGAKQVIKKHLGRLIQVDASEGWIDLDTPEAYQKYFPIFGKDT